MFTQFTFNLSTQRFCNIRLFCFKESYWTLLFEEQQNAADQQNVSRNWERFYYLMSNESLDQDDGQCLLGVFSSQATCTASWGVLVEKCKLISLPTYHVPQSTGDKSRYLTCQNKRFTLEASKRSIIALLGKDTKESLTMLEFACR